MFEFFNAIFLGATLLTNIVLYSDQDYAFPTEREGVVAVSLHREWWREDGEGKCSYTGLMVPYVRDWLEFREVEGLRQPIIPDPEHTAGHAFVINRKVCGANVEPVFRTGVVDRRTGGLLTKHSFVGYDATGKSYEQPHWLDQVLSRIDSAAETSDSAKQFIEFNSKADFPGLAPDISARLKRETSHIVPDTGEMKVYYH